MKTVLILVALFLSFTLGKVINQNESPVSDDLEGDYFKVVRKDLLSQKETKKIPGDILKRSLVRHDSKKLAKSLINLCKQ